jgi:hypothetical protein
MKIYLEMESNNTYRLNSIWNLLSVVPNIVSEDCKKIIILAVVERLSFYDFASFKMVAQNQKK